MAHDEEASIRQRVLDAVRLYPGLHLRGLERQVGASAPLVQYHLRHLVDARLVEAHEHGSSTRYYPGPRRGAKRVAPQDLPLVALLREETPLHIVLILLDEGPLAHADLVARLEVAKSTLSYHLAKLAEAGIVERVPGEARLRVADPARVNRLLRAFAPTPRLLDAFADLWEDLYGSSR